mgnify:CR=1 FL=1
MQHLVSKKFVYIGGILILLALIFFNNSQITPPAKVLDTIPQTMEENVKISNRELSIKNALARPEELKATKINGDTYLLTEYDDTFYGRGLEENKPGQKFGGIVVFKMENDNLKFFWESTEDINMGSVYFKDINNDGVDELVWDGYFGATGRNTAFYIYKFSGDKFDLITPVDTFKITTPEGVYKEIKMTTLSGDNGFTYIKDIDADNVQDIAVGYRDDNNKALVSIYKFNGAEYYLWKEVAESSPEFKELFK